MRRSNFNRICDMDYETQIDLLDSNMFFDNLMCVREQLFAEWMMMNGFW